MKLPAAGEAGTAMYRRAAILQGGTAVLGFLGGIVAWRTSGNRLWLTAAVVLGSAVPLTLLAIKPVNDVLMSPGASRIADVSGVFAQWGRLHLIRTITSGAALLCCLVDLLRRPRSLGSVATPGR